MGDTLGPSLQSIAVNSRTISQTLRTVILESKHIKAIANIIVVGRIIIRRTMHTSIFVSLQLF